MENWQEKEKQQLRQNRSRHTGHFQPHHPRMESTAQQLHIREPQGDSLHRRGSGKKSPFPPEGQTSPELAPWDLPLCRSHLLGAV